MNKKITKTISIMMTMLFAFSAISYADSGDTCIALGKDLDKSGTKTILSYFGIDSIDDYDVIYITNKDEHKYLEDYVPEEQIGNKALSSVMITENDSEDIDVEIYNINYCTEEMYENALETAGVTGADVIVAGPYSISGTAALVGTIKAYEEMTGHKVHDDVIDAAVEELTTTGDIGEEVGNKDAIADIISEIKEKVSEDPDMSEEDIIQAIKDAAAKAGINLSDENIEKIKAMFTKFKGLNIDWKGLANKAKDLANKAGEMGIFDKIVAWFKSLIG